MRTLILGFCFAGLILLWGQPASIGRPEFDVASVKLNNSGFRASSVREFRPGSLYYTNRTLFDYIRLAYGVEGYQISHNGSIWLGDRYDIIAKTANPVPIDQMKLMLRTLLEDRLKLATHRESKEFSVYALVVGKNGPRFDASPEDEPPSVNVSGSEVVYRRSSMADSARMLSNMRSVGRPVLDRTGLSAFYDFTLRLDPPAGQTGDKPKADLGRGLDAAVFSNVENLGLRLEAQKAKLEIVVVDHVEKIPTEN